jgi:hypothetical protein
MLTINAQGPGSNAVSTPVPVTDDTNWVATHLIQVGGEKRGGLITILVGAGGAIAHFKISRAAAPGGTHIDWLTDADFNAPPAPAAIEVLPATGISALAGSANGQIKLHSLGGVQELKLWFKKASADTDVAAEVSFGD